MITAFACALRMVLNGVDEDMANVFVIQRLSVCHQGDDSVLLNKVFTSDIDLVTLQYLNPKFIYISKFSF